MEVGSELSIYIQCSTFLNAWVASVPVLEVMKCSDEKISRTWYWSFKLFYLGPNFLFECAKIVLKLL
uniref:Transcription initiation factor IIA subunit 2 n=1 Tax=Rhizophora mucronata TaxID=61149 RepID=A0A2P2K721_RHIMU